MTTTTVPPYAATAQHLQLLAERRRRLERAQLDAEEQLVASVAREVRAGRLTAAELARIYIELRSIAMPGFSKRWQAELPTLQQIQADAARDERWQREARERLDSWVGPFPVEDREAVPLWGICVVYVLYDQAGAPCYVGSTERFWDRMVVHAHQGKPAVRWQAHRCRDREHAYEVETQFLQQHKPYLNKRAAR